MVLSRRFPSGLLRPLEQWGGPQVLGLEAKEHAVVPIASRGPRTHKPRQRCGGRAPGGRLPAERWGEEACGLGAALGAQLAQLS